MSGPNWSHAWCICCCGWRGYTPASPAVGTDARPDAKGSSPKCRPWLLLVLVLVLVMVLVLVLVLALVLLLHSRGGAADPLDPDAFGQLGMLSCPGLVLLVAGPHCNSWSETLS